MAGKVGRPLRSGFGGIPALAAVAVLVAAAGCQTVTDEFCLVRCSPAPSDDSPWFIAGWYQDIADGDLDRAWDKLSDDARQEYGDRPTAFAAAAPELLAEAGEAATVGASWFSAQEVRAGDNADLVFLVLPDPGDETGAGARVLATAAVLTTGYDTYEIAPPPQTGTLQFTSPEPGTSAPTGSSDELAVTLTGLPPDDRTLRFLAISLDETYHWPDASTDGDQHLLRHVRADTVLLIASTVVDDRWQYAVRELTPEPST